MAIPPGTLLDNKYTIEQAIGRGGFGFVYRAHDRVTGETVAIKELTPALADDPHMVQRFIQEARATLRLTHTYIARTHTIIEQGGVYYLVMEFLPGGSLADRLRGGPMPVEDVLRIAEGLCAALAYAHGEGVVHCDLKPANVLFDARGRVRLADFGIAHISNQMMSRGFHTGTGTTMGTPQYMAPEQLEGVRDDPRVDVYALGALLYELLAGRPYVDFEPGTTPAEQIRNFQRIQYQPPRPLREVNPRVPEWLAGVVEKALAKAPGERFPTVAALSAALRAPPAVPPPVGGTAIAQRPVAAPPPGPAAPSAVPPAARPSAPGAAPAVSPAVPPPAPRATPPPRVVVTPPEVVPPVARPRQSPPTFSRKILPWALGGAGALLSLVLIGVVVAGVAAAIRGAAPAPTAQPTLTLQPSVTSSPPVPPTATPVPLPALGDTWTRSTDGMVMVYVPGGTFEMGSTEAEVDAALALCNETRDDCQRSWFEDEEPMHSVTLDGFWIDRYEVSNGQYARCVAWGACSPPGASSSYTRDSYYGNSAYTEYPVIPVDWNQASAYCEWAGGQLPTEAQWEYAARGPDGYVYPWGNTFDGTRLNYCDSNCPTGWSDTNQDDGYADTAPVGSYPSGASWCGALDMVGNVWEWVADWYGDYASGAQTHPAGPASGSGRVVRGGSWYTNQYNTRSSNRDGYNPDNLYPTVGFRCGFSTPGP